MATTGGQAAQEWWSGDCGKTTDLTQYQEAALLHKRSGACQPGSLCSYLTVRVWICAAYSLCKGQGCNCSRNSEETVKHRSRCQELHMP
jgi:hypothetical protein